MPPHIVPAAAGLLDGAFGATGCVLVWYNLIAVKIATPAKINVVNIIPIVVYLFFIILISIFSYIISIQVLHGVFVPLY